MEHSFDVEVAKKYGMLEAVLLKNLWYWISKNKANDVNFYDGSYWTYNSTRAFSELFIYASQQSIKRALKHLKDEGIIKTGNYNKSSYDRTLWYALTDLGLSIVQVRTIDGTSTYNKLDKNEQCINTDVNTVVNTDMYSPYQENTCKSTSVDSPKVADVVNLYHEICKSYPKVRALSDNRRKAINARLRTHSIDEFREVFEKAERSSFLKGANNRNWAANFDWLINETNFCKVLDGNYDNKGGTSKPQTAEAKEIRYSEEELDRLFGGGS